ncbi:cytochrome p450 [Trifolium pratense]|uniref:Cytochrome p450 n=1 Tax=Trifolium pratense TaxID=57577 RepID=A0A2K3M8I1_TRIPR|nr:cytochrome p450 [Trifolium pratense]
MRLLDAWVHAKYSNMSTPNSADTATTERGNSVESSSNTAGLMASEALSLLHAIRWIQNLQLDNVDFAMDAKTVVDQFHNKGIVLTEVVDVLEECKRLFSLYFENSRVEFTKRCGSSCSCKGSPISS